MFNPIKTLFWSVNAKAKTAVLASMLLLSFIGGVATPTQYHTRHIYHGVEALSPLAGSSEFVDESIALWKIEVARRFPDAVIVVLHGQSLLGEWVCQNPRYPDDFFKAVKVRDLVAEVRAEYPDRIIVLICCNPGHHVLNIPGVYHAIDSVWFTPDEYNTENRGDIPVVGNIYEFIGREL